MQILQREAIMLHIIFGIVLSWDIFIIRTHAI